MRAYVLTQVLGILACGLCAMKDRVHVCAQEAALHYNDSAVCSESAHSGRYVTYRAYFLYVKVVL